MEIRDETINLTLNGQIKGIIPKYGKSYFFFFLFLFCVGGVRVAICVRMSSLHHVETWI
jgi:hypothetical protein